MLCFDDIHTHTRDTGARAIVNVAYGGETSDLRHCSVGMHPWDTAGAFDIDELRRQASKPNVAAIGETGLDALRGAPLDRQEEIFRQHIAISEELGKPLIIHAVKTLQRIIELRRELRPRQLWIIHGYRGKAQMARQLIDNGIAISLGEHFNADTARAIPDDMLYCETDESSLPIATIRERINQARSSI